jgi:hypothetical protein
MKKFVLQILFLFTVILCSPVIAGGIVGYTGNISNANAGVSQSAGSNATASMTVDFKVPVLMGVGTYDTTGVNSNVIFASSVTNFPGGSTFTAAESGGVLVTNEGNLSSKFDLDFSLPADAALMVFQMGSAPDTPSQDLIIKGAVFTNAAAATTITVTTNVNTLVLTGGSGSAPQVALRSMGGVPGGGPGAIVTQMSPALGLGISGAQRNTNGYARYAVVGDVKESSIDMTTIGNWTGSFTVSVTGI